MSRPRGRCLLVPATDVEAIARAFASSPDEVVVDLDSVPAELKDDFLRLAVVAAIGAGRGATAAIQINRSPTRWFDEDIIQIVMAVEIGVDCLVVPAAESSAEVRAAGELLTEIEAEFPVATPIGLEARIDSARGLSALEEIVVASPRLEAIVIDIPDSESRLRAAAIATAAGITAVAGPGPTTARDEALPDGAWTYVG